MTRPRVTCHPSLFLAALLLGAAPALAQRKGSHERWPFGLEHEHAGSMLEGRDLFNLGPLGAKAWDPSRPEPTGARGSGRREFASSGEPGPDVGPERLVVRALFGGGPAQKAGLRYDDVIVGVDGAEFTGGCFAPLADAIRRAEAGNGKLLLQIVRDGKPDELEVKLDKFGKHAETPESGKMREELLEAACDWLADAQQGGGFAETLGGQNGAVVMTCMAGLAWISEGSSLKRGKRKKNLQSAVDFVSRTVGRSMPLGDTGANWDQTTWGYAYAAIFLGELQLAGKTRKLDDTLQEIVDILQKRQEVSGGYGHGPGGKNALGYIELNILAAYVLCGLSVCEQAGCEVDAKIVDKLIGYCEQSAGGDGGVGYATGEGQQGMGNIGRTAGTWLGARGLGRGDQPFSKKMEQYVRDNIAAIMDGHASLQQHITLAGLAAAALDADVQKDYWEKGLRRDLTLARAPDGSFQPRPWHESLMMQSNTDVSVGQVWTTASWAIVLGAQTDGKKGGLPGWTGSPN